MHQYNVMSLFTAFRAESANFFLKNNHYLRKASCKGRLPSALLPLGFFMLSSSFGSIASCVGLVQSWIGASSTQARFSCLSFFGRPSLYLVSSGTRGRTVSVFGAGSRDSFHVSQAWFGAITTVNITLSPRP